MSLSQALNQFAQNLGRYLCARIRYVTANDWSSRRYLNMSRLGDTMQTTD